MSQCSQENLNGNKVYFEKVLTSLPDGRKSIHSSPADHRSYSYFVKLVGDILMVFVDKLVESFPDLIRLRNAEKPPIEEQLKGECAKVPNFGTSALLFLVIKGKKYLLCPTKWKKVVDPVTGVERKVLWFGLVSGYVNEFLSSVIKTLIRELCEEVLFVKKEDGELVIPKYPGSDGDVFGLNPRQEIEVKSIPLSEIVWLRLSKCLFVGLDATVRCFCDKRFGNFQSCGENAFVIDVDPSQYNVFGSETAFLEGKLHEIVSADPCRFVLVDLEDLEIPNDLTKPVGLNGAKLYCFGKDGFPVPIKDVYEERTIIASEAFGTYDNGCGVACTDGDVTLEINDASVVISSDFSK